MGAKRKIAVALVLLIAGGAYWTTGRADHALRLIGPNYTTCVQNGFGNWFCGDAAEKMVADAAREKKREHARKVAARLAKTQAEVHASQFDSEPTYVEPGGGQCEWDGTC